MSRFTKSLGWIISILIITAATVLSSSKILASTDAEPGSITIIKTEYQTDSLTNFEYQLESPGDPSMLLSWGSQGSGDGEFEWSKTGIDVDRSGNIYVADELNHRIQKFDSSGNLILSWGSFGTAEGQFDSPSDVEVNSLGSYVYVVDTNNHRIQMFNSSGNFVSAWGWGVSTGANAFETCTGSCLAGNAGSGEGQFSSPRGIAFGSSSQFSTSYVFVTDSGNNRIQYFGTDGTYEDQWGEAGSAEGQFNNPSGIALDRTGNVYVADTMNYRIQRFSIAGEFIRMWGYGVTTGRGNLEVCTVGCQAGIPGSGEGQFSEPLDVDVDKVGYVYVADTSNILQKFSPAGNYVHEWGGTGSGEGQFDGLAAIGVDFANNVYAVDINNYRIQKFVASSFLLNIQFESYDGIPDRLTYQLPAATYTINEIYSAFWYNLPQITCQTSDGGEAPLIASPSVTINLDPGENVTCTFYNVMEQGNITIEKEENPPDGTDFQFLWGSWDLPDTYLMWGESGNKESQFNIPAGIAADSSGNVYAVDRDNNRVQKFDAESNFIGVWGWGVQDGSNSYQICTSECQAGSYGGGEGKFDQPVGIAVDSADNVYVVDSNNHRIQKFDSSGNFILEWGVQGSSEGQFESPNWIAVDSSDNIYVVDQGNNRIQKFLADGTFQSAWGSSGSGDGQFTSAQGIAVTKADAVSNADQVYVADSGNSRIQVFDLDGNFVSAWGSPGSGESQFDNPTGVAADSEGDVFVVDKGNDRIQKFQGDGTFLSTWGRTGSFQEEFNQPAGIAVDSNGYIFITEQFNQRINEFRVTVLILDDEPDPNDDDEVDGSVTFQGNTGTYKVTELGPVEGWRLKSITCETNDTSEDPIIESPSVTFNLDRDEEITCTFYNTRYEDPVADFSAEPTEGLGPLDVQFTNLSTGDYDTCTWDFGDGGTSSECVDPIHTYTDHGYFTVSLTVEGPEGENTKTIADYIWIYEPNVADFSGDPPGGLPPLDVQFTNLSTGDFDTCSWDFGDGETNDSCEDPPLHRYEATGPYTVTLSVSGGLGGEDTEIKQGYINVYVQPVADFSATPRQGIAALDVQFTNLTSGDYHTCSWDFGDGGTSSECADPLYTYADGGVYTVSLTVNIPGGGDTETKTNYITVYEPVVADFSADPTSGVAPLSVQFTNLSSGDYDTCSWNFGDGSTGNQCNDPTHNYTSEGIYTVSLTVSGDGGDDTITKTGYITVYEPAEANFSAKPTAGISPLNVQFTNLSSGDYDTCSWDFGDGGTSSECNDPSHNYTAHGVYSVSLTVTGNGGEDTETKTNYITIYEPVLADFSANPREGAPGLDVDFTNLSSGDYDTCNWNFGDGGTSTVCTDPSHTYEESGLYTVSLTVSGLGGEDTEIKADYIWIYGPPLADFSANPTYGIAPLDVQFTDLSTGEYDTCSWDFGDGSTSNVCGNPLHTYSNPGVYTVSLSLIGPAGDDIKTEVDYITVYTPVQADFSGTPTEGLEPLEVDFTFLATGDYDTCTWDFGDGTTYEACGNISYEYTVPGTYTVSLTVQGNGGEDVETKTNYIVVLPYYYNYMPIIMQAPPAVESNNFIQSVIDFFMDLIP